jgi:hypothetical protein
MPLDDIRSLWLRTYQKLTINGILFLLNARFAFPLKGIKTHSLGGGSPGVLANSDHIESTGKSGRIDNGGKSTSGHPPTMKGACFLNHCKWLS